MIENLLVAEELIIERLENTIDDIKILSTAELSGVTERSQIIPAIHVVYAGYKLETEGQAITEHGIYSSKMDHYDCR